MEEAVFKAALAGLLHDIGKFAQRADAPLREIPDAETRKQVRYEHALASYSFVQDFAAALPTEIRRGLSGVAYHHAPKSDLDEVIRLADWLSAGERDELDGSQDDRRVPYLRSIFSRLHGLDDAWYLPLARLHFEWKTLFPTQHGHAEWNDAYRAEYYRLWEQFTQACEPLKQISDPAIYLETLYNRLLEFTWCIPSAYYNAVPDVSLYDHSRMTAALAACLAQDKRDGAWCRSLEDGDQAAVLVAGDVSGVQDFIYTLASAGAARTLRGRSFYIQLLTEVVADFVLGRLGLPPSNLIYAGGGNFYLLAGLTQGERLAALSQEVTRRLVKAHGGALRLALAWRALTRAEFQRTRFADAWRRLHEDGLLPVKHRPLGTLESEELYSLVGQTLGVGGDNDQQCSICGAERHKGERFDTDESGAETIRKCELCQSFEQLGRALADASHLVWLQAALPEAPAEVRSWQTGLANFGARFALVNADKPLAGKNALPDLDGTTLARLSQIRPASDATLRDALSSVPVIDVVRPLAQLAPCDERGYPLTFDQLAEKSILKQKARPARQEGRPPQEEGSSKKAAFKRWGVLRMDVDNLGQVFQYGFESRQGDNLTLSRLAALSLSLRLFFEGWLPHLAGPQPEDTTDLSDRLYLQYAGGDDLFLVGDWEALPLFAARVRRSFADYVCHNSHVTLSGGISLADPHYPLYQAAREAQDAERAAKGLRPAKNALTFLGQPAAWEDFGPALERAYELAGWCWEKDAPRSLIQTLIEIGAEYKRSSRDGRLQFGRWMWVLAYQLTRAAARARDTQVKEGIIAIRDQLLAPGGLVQTIGLSARWAQLLIRE